MTAPTDHIARAPDIEAEVLRLRAALEEIAAEKDYSFSPHIEPCPSAAAEIASAALKGGRSMTATHKAPGAVRVKPLVWENANDSRYVGGWNPNMWVTRGAAIGYAITHMTPKNKPTAPGEGKFRMEVTGAIYNWTRDFDTLDAAVAAAQADYEARILSALEPTPDAIRAAALEDAAKVADCHAAPLHGKAAKCRKRGDEMGEAVFDSAISEASSIAAAIRALIEPTEGGA